MIKTINYFILFIIISYILSIPVIDLLTLDPQVIDNESDFNMHIGLFMILTCIPLVISGDPTGIGILCFGVGITISKYLS
jgi:hypothetical protein